MPYCNDRKLLIIENETNNEYLYYKFKYLLYLSSSLINNNYKIKKEYLLNLKNFNSYINSNFNEKYFLNNKNYIYELLKQCIIDRYIIYIYNKKKEKEYYFSLKGIILLKNLSNINKECKIE